MKIIIQAFSDDSDAENVESLGDTVAEVETFERAHESLDRMEKNGV